MRLIEMRSNASNGWCDVEQFELYSGVPAIAML